MSSVSSTLLTLSSSAIRSVNGRSRSRIIHGHSQFRQRQAHAQLLGLAQRRARRAHLADLVHVGDQLAGRRAATSASGQSVRCTDRSPVTPRQITSVISGSSGAASRRSPPARCAGCRWRRRSSSQNRERDRRTYQFVSASVNWRSWSHAPEMSQTSSDAVRSSRSAASLARM